ncbi:tetratricopeptide repeat protein [Montanilutibacter psychrotolerans]|uniref:PgaA membrane beta barrel domain-containing protein n=1 Tax=Montanilutibacter psychrotolerans TaxID=1327343 RepID=A0A3M8SST5_9GAMM|nr:tetratricopeptide repeat protein [Lysobacter psychrotolerans]RNF83853.1 hypothetical protein EER27_10890 [Lysobacter psychrotolerans]
MAQIGKQGFARAGLLALAFATTAPAIAADQAPPDPAAQRSLADQARQAAWDGRIGRGIALMDRHLAEHPDDRAARLDRARFLAWRGDHAGALATLDAMGPAATGDAEVQSLRARIHAWAGRRDAALALNTPLYRDNPDSPDTAWTQALAARLGEWPHEGLSPLSKVIAARPDEPDTRTLAQAVRLPMFSWVGAPFGHYEDDDDIQVDTFGLDASLRVSPTWRLNAQAQRREYRAPAPGPFAPVTGGDSADDRRLGLGARASLSPDTAVSLMLTQSRLDTQDNRGQDSELLGRAELNHRASDAFKYSLRLERERVAASPRSLTLGVLRDTVAADVLWTPNLRDRISGHAAFDDHNDDNTRHWLLVDWRHAVMRADRATLDLGLQGEWMGYANDPGNGYYSPSRYARIAPVAASYIYLGQNAGLNLQAAIGVQRDASFDGWKRATDLSAELTVGIYSRWQMVARAAYSERLNEFGQYEGSSIGLELRYRFCDHRADECPATAE